MERSFLLASALGLVVSLGGCNEPTLDTDSDTATDTDADTKGSESAGSESEGSESEGESDAEPEFVPILARNITVDRVQVNQGVGIDVVRDGAWVEGKDRSSYILQNRLTLVRGFWTVGPDWQPRRIRGHLTVYYPDGSTHEESQTITIESDSFEGDLKRTFYFGLMPEQVVPGIEFEFDLWETDFGYEGTPEPDPPPRAPYNGKSLVGVEESDHLLRVVIVPFNYRFGTCDREPDTSDATMKLFRDYMFMQYPVDRLEIELHAPVLWDKELTDFTQLNSYMSGLRFEEGAGPEVFYYGLIDACSGGVGGAGGKAYGIPDMPPKQAQAYQRVSSGLSLRNNVKWSAETFIHEVGHSLGRRHINCGGAAGFDPTYPYDGGEVGEWGFGIVDFALRHPNVSKDYMTYCNPTWTGNWAWSKLYPTIRTLTEWIYESPPAPGSDLYGGSLLVGSIYPDGKTEWITVPGSIRPESLSATDRVDFLAGGETVASQAAQISYLPDGIIKQVVVPLPEDFEAVTEFAHVAGDQARRIAIDAVSQHHTARTIRAR